MCHLSEFYIIQYLILVGVRRDIVYEEEKVLQLENTKRTLGQMYYKPSYSFRSAN